MNTLKTLLGLITMLLLMSLNLAFAQNKVTWDFENGNDHGFTLSCTKPAEPAPDDPAIAGDESITGVGGNSGLPDAGLAWTIGLPNMFDGLAPAMSEGCHVVDGVLLYGPCNDPFAAAAGDPPYNFTNGRGQSGYLGTYQLNQWGDNLHSAANDQVATSPAVVLEEGAELTIWAYGNTTASWAGTRIAPVFDEVEGEGYATGSGGIVVLSAADGSLLANLLVAAEGGNGNMPAEFKLDLSAFAGQKVIVEVVDAFAGGWGFLVVDEIQIANATEAALENMISWNFENGNDHGFTLRCINPAAPADDDPDIAGDESITGVVNPSGEVGLPVEGVAWTIGSPDQFDEQFPAVIEGCHVVDDFLLYGPCNDPFGAAVGDPPFDFTNGRGQSGYLNTYNLNQWGDMLHLAINDQIATSPKVMLGEGAELTVWAVGNTTASWAGTRIAPEFDLDPANGYVDGSGGIAVLSAAGNELLASLLVAAEGIDETRTPDMFTLDLSPFAGREVIIEVVDAFEGGWGWFAFDEIQITNAATSDTKVENKPSIVKKFYLAQNYPNPFNPSTNIEFEILLEGYVTLSVFNVLGQPVATLLDQELKSGTHHVTFDAADFPAGIYYYRIQANGDSQVKKMMLLK